MLPLPKFLKKKHRRLMQRCMCPETGMTAVPVKFNKT